MPQCPSAPLLRVADSRSRSRSRSRRRRRRFPCRVDISFEGRYRERSAKCATASGGGQSNGGDPIRGRGSQQALLRGCHVPSPGLISKMNALLTLFRTVARSAQASARRASRRATGCWPFSSMSLGSGRQQTTSRELETLPSARQTAPLALLLFASAGGVWSAVELRPTYAPNLWSHVSQRRLPSQNPIGAKKQPQSLSPTQCCYARGPAFVLLCYIPPLEHSACAAGRALICVIFDGAYLLEHLGSLQCASAPAVFACLDILQIGSPKFVQEPCLIIRGRGLSTTDQDRIYPCEFGLLEHGLTHPAGPPATKTPENGRFFRHQWPRSRPFCHPSEHPHELLISVTR